MPFYRIQKFCEGLDGLVVEGHPYLIDYLYDNDPEAGSSPDEDIPVVQVTRFFDVDAIVGDRVVSVPVKGRLYIDADFLEKAEDPRSRQFDSKNPWGKFLFEGKYQTPDGHLHVDLAQYDHAMQVTVSEVDGLGGFTTLFTDYFFRFFDEVRGTIEFNLGEGRAEDLIFSLRTLKTTEMSSMGAVSAGEVK